ncbi:MAG: hypothetical protein ACRBBW_13005 [Cellvibrionaceae bacterium]
MSAPVEQIYRATLKSTVDDFITRIPLACHDYSDITDPTAVKALVELLEQYWKTHQTNIIRATGQKITTYLSTYDVLPRGSIDEFKAIYFVGSTLSSFLEREKIPRLRSLVEHIMIDLLDYRLFMRHGKIRQPLSKRLHKMAESGTLSDELGPLGMYLLYKCLFNEMESCNC